MPSCRTTLKDKPQGARKCASLTAARHDSERSAIRIKLHFDRSAAQNHPLRTSRSHWFALHPSTPIGKNVAAPPDCGSPEYARLGALCSQPVFRQMEDEWVFIKRTKSGFEYYREFEGGEMLASQEAAWRAEVGKCNGDYVCSFNAYTSWLKKFNFGLEAVFFKYR